MQRTRFDDITRGFAGKRIVVCGDFFLDRYLWVDPARAEISIETGHTAHQVTHQTFAPGAAGTVAANLAALGAKVICVGVIGDDGDGLLLRQGLHHINANDSLLVVTPDRVTPTYTKPSIRHADGSVQELERLDIRSRTPLAATVGTQIAASLMTLADECDAMVFADQMPEAGCGVIGTAVHEAIQTIVHTRPQLPMFADSRQRIADFRGVIVKPNLHEATHACQLDATTTSAHTAASQLSRHTQRPVVVTLGSMGALVYAENASTEVSAIPVDAPIDVVGAGDSVMAALAISSASGARLAEATQIAMLVAAVTVRKIGTTGTASIPELVEIATRYAVFS
ncbi:MAG: PfkB family carbohydrate kinase [Chloroflexaceae bacterium]|jgi:rfaE bifunctional protein kinase chain/domain|nr:PfkB family carbohydrate kinase [Chloroflexaceae bacterium]MCE2851647.1 PfkB family carbohydrate kinase [Chloroflexaceae bacterium]